MDNQPAKDKGGLTDEEASNPSWLARVLGGIMGIGTVLVWGRSALLEGSLWIGVGLIGVVYVAAILAFFFRKKGREHDAPFMVGLLLGTVFGGIVFLVAAVPWSLGCLIWGLWRGVDVQTFTGGLRACVAFGLIVALFGTASFMFRGPPRPKAPGAGGEPPKPQDLPA